MPRSVLLVGQWIKLLRKIHASFLCFFHGFLISKSLSSKCVFCRRYWFWSYSRRYWYQSVSYGLSPGHDNPVVSVRISPNSLKVLCTTSTGNVGCLDIQSRDYRTVMRSHLDSVLAFSVERLQNQIVTVSQDNTIRVWNLETMEQVMSECLPVEMGK